LLRLLILVSLFRLGVRRLDRVRRHLRVGATMNELSACFLDRLTSIRIVFLILRNLNASSVLAGKYIVATVRSHINIFTSH